MNKSGIYMIKNTINNKFYIGSSKNILKRFQEHKRRLFLDKHSNAKLQTSYNKYGLNAFQFTILELCNIDILIKIEQNYIDKLNPVFNIAKIANAPMQGRKHSVKTKELLKIKRKANLSSGMKNKTHSNEFKENLSLYMKAKMAINVPFKGKKHTDSAKNKIRQYTINRNMFYGHPMLGKKQNPVIMAIAAKLRYKPVRCIQTKAIFESVKKAGEVMNIPAHLISACLNGRQKTTRSYSWEYIRKEDYAF